MLCNSQVCKLRKLKDRSDAFWLMSTSHGMQLPQEVELIMCCDDVKSRDSSPNTIRKSKRITAFFTMLCDHIESLKRNHKRDHSVCDCHTSSRSRECVSHSHVTFTATDIALRPSQSSLACQTRRRSLDRNTIP